MATMRVAQIPSPKKPFALVERPIPEPGAGSVRIKVQSCGICHSDSLVKEGGLPWIKYPRSPGHEVAGVVDAVGSGDYSLLGTGSLTWHATGGNPGGFVSGLDPSGGTFMFQAPISGVNYSAFIGGTASSGNDTLFFLAITRNISRTSASSCG